MTNNHQSQLRLCSVLFCQKKKGPKNSINVFFKFSLIVKYFIKLEIYNKVYSDNFPSFRISTIIFLFTLSGVLQQCSAKKSLLIMCPSERLTIIFHHFVLHKISNLFVFSPISHKLSTIGPKRRHCEYFFTNNSFIFSNIFRKLSTMPLMSTISKISGKYPFLYLVNCVKIKVFDSIGKNHCFISWLVILFSQKTIFL